MSRLCGKRRAASPPREEGAVVILALFLVTTIGLTAGALATMGAVALSSTASLQHVRNVEYAGDAAVEAAVQELRYQAPSNPLTCPNFPSPAKSTVTIDGVSLVVECSIGLPPSFYERVVQFEACPATSGATSPSLATCTSTAVVQATVVYDDVKAGCTSGAISGCYGSYWGTGVSVESWNVIHADG